MEPVEVAEKRLDFFGLEHLLQDRVSELALVMYLAADVLALLCHGVQVGRLEIRRCVRVAR